MPMMPAFAAQCPTIGGTSPAIMPAIDAALMMTPPPRLTRWGQANFDTKNGMSSSPAIVARQSWTE